jgi:fumarate reductase flavoprotein subunit
MNARVRAEKDAELRHFLADGSPETFAWLQRLGVEFVGPFPEPPHRVARMHNVVPGSKA